MQTLLEGIVLKETLYSETSKVLQILTKEHGLISVIAKGALNPKSNLRMLTIPFLYGNFDISYKKNKLSLLKGGKVIKLYGLNKHDLKLYAYLSYISEITYSVLKENNDREIFDIYKSGVDKMDEGLNYDVIKNIILFKYLNYLGISPNLEVCSKCNQNTDFMAIDGKRGGFICSSCYSNERKVPSNFYKIVKRFMDVDINEIKDIKLSSEDSLIIDEFLNEYYETFSAVYLNSSKFLSMFK